MKKIKTFLTVISSFAFIMSTSAQLEKTIHQTFEIGDATTVILNLTGEIEIQPWASNSVMTKTVVQLFDASPAILNHLVEKEKRYAIEAEVAETSISINSTVKERKPINTHQGACPERVIIQVFLPDSFVAADSTNTTFVRNPKN